MLRLNNWSQSSPTPHPVCYADEAKPWCWASPVRILGSGGFFELSQISLIIYCFLNSDEMILLKKQKDSQKREDNVKVKWELWLLAFLPRLSLPCVRSDPGADCRHFCASPASLSFLTSAPHLTEGGCFNVHSQGWSPADPDTPEGPIWLSQDLFPVSGHEYVSLSAKREGGLLPSCIFQPSGSPPEGVLPPGVVWQSLETFLVVTTGGHRGRSCYWHLLGWVQGCCWVSFSAQDSPHNKLSGPQCQLSQEWETLL